MSKISGGYILKARKTLESELMDKPPLWSKLWDWMLLRAEWREGKKLKRGQFHTTIAEMQEAMSWTVGYRKETPTKDQIRKAYEGFTKATMATTMKATRGMVITITNYDLYQDPKNYEAHSEDAAKVARKPHEGTQDSKEVRSKNESNKKSKISFVEGSNELRLATYLFNCIRKNNPEHKKPNLQTWATHIDYMIRLDKRDPGQIKEVIKWCQENNQPDGNGFCWSRNILSTDKLRKQYDQLVMRMNSEDGGMRRMMNWMPPELRENEQ